jgi:DNA (cytosine-5)-methyltransferase 1
MTVLAPEVVDTFSGPGGWEEGMRQLGIINVLGIEWETHACNTARAAGHHRLQADITTLDPADYLGATGHVSSPPCTKFSTAGDGVGRQVIEQLADGIRALFAGRDVRADIVAAILPTCLASQQARNAKRRKPWTEEKVAAKAAEDAITTALVLEPARWITTLSTLRWVALEQVPSVLPLWQVYAECLRAAGWSVWCGVLNAADYGVPQTRKRAILIASRDRHVSRPEPTHAEHPQPTLFGDVLPWVSMADALGWGGVVGFPRLADGGESTPDGYRSRDLRPSPTLTSTSRLWKLVNGNQANAAERDLDQPAPTMHFGHCLNSVRWVHDRPATTIVASYRPDIVAGPGHHDTSRQDAPGSIQITPTEAAILQSFRADYPWQGARTRQFEQIGNAVPPRLAAHVVAAAIGLSNPYPTPTPLEGLRAPLEPTGTPRNPADYDTDLLGRRPA